MPSFQSLNRLIAACAAGAALLFCAAVLLCCEGAAPAAQGRAADTRTQDNGAYTPLQNNLFCLYESNGGAPLGGSIQAARPQSGCARLRRIALKFNHVFMRGGEIVLSAGGSFLNPALSIQNSGAHHEVWCNLVVSLRKLRL